MKKHNLNGVTQLLCWLVFAYLFSTSPQAAPTSGANSLFLEPTILIAQRRDDDSEDTEGSDGQMPPEIPQAPHFLVPIGTKLYKLDVTKIMSTIKRGQTVGRYQKGHFMGVGCTFFPPAANWSGTRFNSLQTEFRELITNTLQGIGYKTNHQEEIIFGNSQDLPESQFQLGAILETLDVTLCEQASAWDGNATGAVSGKATVRVKWKLFSNLEHRVVFERDFTGNGKIEQFVMNGIWEPIYIAFADSLSRMGAEPEFLALLTKGYSSNRIANRSTSLRTPKNESILTLVGPHLKTGKFETDSKEIQKSTVTVSRSDRFGSGFFITRDGYILTNWHVVQETPDVSIRLFNGITVPGHVIEKDRVRDVALIKVPLRDVAALALNQKPVRVGESVFAIGTPIKKSLSGTVSKGIISAIRLQGKSKNTLIQADVDIHAGNSGGPLVDASGNVVGITVSGIGKDEFSVGINFFIPIREALNALRLRVN